MAARAFITGLAGLSISADERAFIREAEPWGLILFKRNVNTPAQVTDLTDSFRAAVGWEAPVFVDQEGGRVQRLGPPHWPAYPAGQRHVALYDREPAAGLPPPPLAPHFAAPRLRHLGHDRALPAVGRRAGGKRRSGDRGPPLRPRGGESSRHRESDCERLADRGSSPGVKAPAWPRPSHRR